MGCIDSIKERIHERKKVIFISLVLMVTFICLAGLFIFLDKRYAVYQH